MSSNQKLHRVPFNKSEQTLTRWIKQCSLGGISCKGYSTFRISHMSLAEHWNLLYDMSLEDAEHMLSSLHSSPRQTAPPCLTTAASPPFTSDRSDQSAVQ